MPSVLCADPPHSGCAARHSLVPKMPEEVRRSSHAGPASPLGAGPFPHEAGAVHKRRVTVLGTLDVNCQRLKGKSLIESRATLNPRS